MAGHFVYYGNGSAGSALNPRQRSYDGTTPVVHLGSSGPDAGFGLGVIGRSPFGWGNVTLQWQVKPFGTTFDGTGLEESRGWYDTGTAGVEISELVTGLNSDTLYHWRLRLLYDPVRYPFMAHSRWLTFPTGGASEADLRTGTWVYDTDDDGIKDGETDPNVNESAISKPIFFPIQNKDGKLTIIYLE